MTVLYFVFAQCISEEEADNRAQSAQMIHALEVVVLGGLFVGIVACVVIAHRRERTRRQARSPQEVGVQLHEEQPQMMAVQVPEGMQGGMMLQVQTPAGMMQVQIPQGLATGQTFHMPLAPPPVAEAHGV